MIPSKYVKIVINTPERGLFTFLQQNILYEDVEMFYFSDLLEIEEFIQRIKPNILVTYISQETLISDEALVFFRSPFLNETRIIFLLSSRIPLTKIKMLGDFEKSLVLLDDTKPEIIAHNIKTILKKEKSDLDEYSNRTFAENLYTYAKMVNEEMSIAPLFEKLVNYLPKIVQHDYLAVFSYDPESRQVNEFDQFIPPHFRSGAIITPNLEKLAGVWINQKKDFRITSNEDPKLFKKLKEWGWNIKSLEFFPMIQDKLPVGGIIFGDIKIVAAKKAERELVAEITDILGLKLVNYFYSQKGNNQGDDFAEQLIHNRFSDESIIQISCRKLNLISNADNTIFWQINKGFGFLFPKYNYSTEKNASWKALEKTMLFFTKDPSLNQLITSEKISYFEKVLINGKFTEATLKTFKDLGYHNLLIVPIKIQGEESGLFFINRGEGKLSFSDWEMNQIAKLMEKIQRVLEDTQVIKEANLKIRQLSRIFELGNDIKLELNLENILARINKSIRKILGWNDVTVLRNDSFREVYQNVSKIGFDNNKDLPLNILGDVKHNDVEQFLLNCDSVSHSHFYDSHPINVNGDGTNFLEDGISEWHNEDLLMVPIETRNNKLGYLVVRDPVDRLKPNVDKVISLEYFANQAAVAIENAFLYENLLSSEERYRALAETMSLGLVTCSTEDKIIYVNPAFEDLVSLENQVLLDKPITKFFTDESQSKLQDILKKINDSSEIPEKNLKSIELELFAASGETIPVSTLAFPLIKQGEKRGFFLVLSDLRVVKRLERLKEDFNSMIVHDLRSPMNVIQGFIELIRTRVVGEINSEQEELLDIAKENVKKVLTLIDNFLVASKMEVGKFGIEPKVSEVNTLIDRTVENHKVLLKNKNINLECKLNPNLPLLYFDGLRLEQVINNLLSNAIKFTPEGGKISVNSEFYKQDIKGEEKMYVRISVHDTGPGIPQEHVKYVFEKYEQIDSDELPKSSGTGLGLAICKEIIGLHGGDIWVESVVNKGSKFYFTIPIEPSIDKVMKE